MTRTLLQRLGVLAGTVVLVVVGWLARGAANEPAASSPTEVRPADIAKAPPLSSPGLPREAVEVLARIAQGGPHPYRQDGGVFGNREDRLPARPRGYYREYTVPTPGERDRGPRRIVTGGDPPVEYFYTDDHYRTFRPIAGPR